MLGLGYKASLPLKADSETLHRNGHSLMQIGHKPLDGLVSSTLVVVLVVDIEFRYEEFF
jgi:hypothetical protein